MEYQFVLTLTSDQDEADQLPEVRIELRQLIKMALNKELPHDLDIDVEPIIDDCF